jgi:hypothetical protein
MVLRRRMAEFFFGEGVGGATTADSGRAAVFCRGLKITLGMGGIGESLTSQFIRQNFLSLLFDFQGKEH